MTEGELASHSHYVGKGKGNGSAGTVTNNFLYLTQWEGSYEYDISTSNVGGNNPHNNLPPLYGVYRFRRIR
nr:MAG TPA: Baseplate structural protein [Caudoviricetes sp.]